MQIYGHRGVPEQAPENTLSSFAAAARSGVDGVELDVTLLADGTPVVSHDDSLSRCCQQPGKLSELQHSQLSLTNAAANWPGFAAEPIPTLGAVIDQLNQHQLALNLELKDYGFPSLQVAQAIQPMLRRFHCADQLIISSFSLPLLAAVRQLNPEQQLGLLYEKLPEDWQHQAERLNAFSLHLNWRYLCPEDAQSIRQSGYQLVLWTLDAPDILSPDILSLTNIVISNQPQEFMV